MSDTNTQAHREAVAARIRALLAKTVANGATEHEALAAAAKARQIMDAHRLTQSDVEVQAEPIETEYLDRPTTQKVAAVDLMLHGLEKYCGVETWYNNRYDPKLGRSVRRLAIFGLKSDVEMARYLYQMVAATIRIEADRYIAANRPPRDPALTPAEQAHLTIAVSKSFQVGMGRRIGQRLHEMAQEANATAKTSSGTALVVVKNAVVADAYAALGLKLSGGLSGPRATNHAAWQAGRAAGDRVNLGRPVGTSGPAKQIGG